MTQSWADSPAITAEPHSPQTLLALTIQLLAATVSPQEGERLGPDTVPWSELELDSVHLVWVGSGLQEWLGASLDVASAVRGLDVRTMRRMTIRDFAEHLSTQVHRTSPGN